MEYKKITYQKWKLQYEAIDLSEFGIANVAFDLPSAVAFMCEAANEGFKILGGDIIVPYKDELTESCDNWSSNASTASETLQDALRYLSKYWRKNDPNWYISVITSE